MGQSSSPAPRRDADAAATGWDDIAIFDAVARGGALAVAAATLGLSETTVTRRLKAFERHLGVALFHRAANRLILTETGAGLAGEARSIAAAVERFASRARSARTAERAPVRVTAATSISLFLTMHATAISSAAGGVEIVIISTRDRLDLARGDADIAIRMTRIPEGPGYFGQRIGSLMQALYVRRDVDPDTAPVISVNREVSSRIEAHIAAYAGGRQITARVGDSAARYESIRSGGLSMAPCFMADADETLRRLDDPPEATADPIFLVSHEISRQREAVKAVLAALRNVFAANRAKLEGRG